MIQSESGISYGTPHDLASLYGNKRDKSVGPAQVPTGYDEKTQGRPTEKPQNYGSDQSNFSRDPLGKQGLTPGKQKNNQMVIEFLHLKQTTKKIPSKTS